MMLSMRDYELDRQKEKRDRRLFRSIRRQRRWGRFKRGLENVAYLLATLAVGVLFVYAWRNGRF